MKNKRSFIIGIITVLFAVSMTACGSSDAKEKVDDLVEIKEQPSIEIQEPEKIYPEEKLAQDEIVSNSNIEKFLSEYNSNANTENKIDSGEIRYNKNGDYYYVYDKSKNSGLKFRLGDFGQIISASVYKGNRNTNGVNLVDMATAAMNTFGYSGMSDKDKQTLADINKKFNETSDEIHSKISLFDGKISIDTTKEGNLNSIEIPSMQSLASDNSIKDSENKANDTLSELKKNSQLNSMQ